VQEIEIIFSMFRARGKARGLVALRRLFAFDSCLLGVVQEFNDVKIRREP
jgi:hypothetical protein